MIAGPSPAAGEFGPPPRLSPPPEHAAAARAMIVTANGIVDLMSFPRLSIFRHLDR
jgi:hypothetical protein